MIVITYTQTLIDWIKKTYPENKKLHDLAEAGDESIGEILKSNIPKDPTFNEIADIKTVEGLLELRSTAVKAKRKINLYELWIKEMHAAYIKDSQLKPRGNKNQTYDLVIEDYLDEITNEFILIKTNT